ncbi:hypothetical protein HYU23_03015 [Candidatus Woesearchaeota archaeon]|nr:hypothetical protein [Candidatus Woesearchaeota archaeon]
MQIALKKTLKKVAAVSTSLALAGITVSSALAAGLGDLPVPFGSSPAMNVVVYGAAGSDMAAVNDVVSAVGGKPVNGDTYTLSGMNTAPLMASDFGSGQREDIAVGAFLNASFGVEVDETDAVGLWDGKIAIDVGSDTDYDAHEVFDIGNGMQLTAALDEGDEDYKTNVVLLVPEEGFGYRMEFEENLDANNFISNATSDDTVTLPFLGKSLVITTATATTMTAYAGDKVKLKIGDTVRAGDKSIRLEGVDDNSALVTVDGEAESIDEGDRERVNGVELFVDDVFNSDDDANDQALLVVQGDTGQAIETYSDGDEFIDENEDHYLWEWNLAGLNNGTASAITLGLVTHESLSTAEDDEFDSEIMKLGLLKENRAYLMEGDYLCLPYRYACLVFEGPDGDLTWNDYEFDANNQKENLDPDNDGDNDVTNANVVEVRARSVGSDRGWTSLDTDNNGDVTDFDTWWIWHNSTGGTSPALAQGSLMFFRSDTDSGDPERMDLNNDGSVVGAADQLIAAGPTAALSEINVVRFDDGDYNARVTVRAVTNSSFVLIIQGINGAGNLSFNLINNSASGLSFLGDRDGEDTSPSLNYTVAGATALSISGFDNDVRRRDGVVIKDPDGNLDNDRVRLSVPNDDEYEFWVKLAKPKGGSAGVVKTGSTAPAVASLTMKDTEVTDVETLGKNVIAVGGPAVNKVVATKLGLPFPTYGAGVSGLSEGKAMLELKDLTSGKKMLLVYGWEADDTKRAALVVKNKDAFSAQLKDKMSVTVTGTSLQVSGITVA